MDCPVNKEIILASASPRRRQLLREIAPQFTIAPSRDIDETYPDDLPPEDVAPYISRKKANGYADLINEKNILITADTIVIIDGRILGKPHSRKEAVAMLETISGRTHKVITGITVKTDKEEVTVSCSTNVTFDKISREEIEAYVDEYKPFDKAGAYGIQEWIGCRGIRKIDGCFYNVMGLPLNTLYKTLRQLQSTFS